MPKFICYCFECRKKAVADSMAEAKGEVTRHIKTTGHIKVFPFRETDFAVRYPGV